MLVRTLYSSFNEMKLASVLQFLLGFAIGIALLVGTGAATAYYFFTRLSALPPKPEFPPQPETVVPVGETAATATVATATEAAVVAPSPASEPEPAPPEEEPVAAQPETIQERFGEDAYRARVTWPQGLSLRASPTLQASRVGGIYYNDEVVAIGLSTDGRWQKVYIPASGQQAWVKAGNVARFE